MYKLELHKTYSKVHNLKLKFTICSQMSQNIDKLLIYSKKYNYSLMSSQNC